MGGTGHAPAGMRLCLALALLLVSAAQGAASRDADVVARAFPACAELRDAMQAECWTPMVVLAARRAPFVEHGALWNRCAVIYEAAMVACPTWPRTPRTAGWRAWYRDVRQWGLPAKAGDAAPLDAYRGCLGDPKHCS